MRSEAPVLSVVAFAVSIAVAACTTAEPSTDGDARLRNADRDAANWLMYGRTYNEQRFSPLQQINEGTVKRLGLVWSRPLPTTRGVEATSLVVDGVIYTTGPWSVVYAIDAKSGEQRWSYDPKVDRGRARIVCCDVVNRGAAYYRGKVYAGTIDGRLVALNAATGSVVWDVLTIDPAKPYAITGAPRIANGMVLIGNAGAEYNVRGYVSAYDAETGAMKWRTYTVPGNPSEGLESEAIRRAATTWKGEWWVAGGGGTVWDAIVFDPELQLVFVGTGNADPWYRDLRGGGGENLYGCSILALRADTGEQVWHFQLVPGDHWDYDATQPLMLADLAIGGRTRKVIMQAAKNAFFYVLDRATGEFISANPYAEMTWASGVDSKTGRPIESPTAYDGMNPVLVTPGPDGAHNWYPMAFHPETGFVYIPVKNGSSFIHAPDSDWRAGVRNFNAGIKPGYEGPLLKKFLAAPPPRGRLVAWNPVQRRAAWTVDLPVAESGGVLATAGNLVFQGRGDGIFAAYRATDGVRLWEFDAGTGIMAPPVTYLVDGMQYLTLMVGWGGAAGLINPPGMGPVKPGFGRILTFALDGTTPLRVPPFGHTTRPVPPLAVTASAATVKQGGTLYDGNCAGCHGVFAVAGSLPDLRYASAAVHEQFEKIVLGGARASLGMPAFGDLLSSREVNAIQQYVLWRAHESAKE
jgi:quinohemoprotein ethanol dehydrogenase